MLTFDQGVRLLEVIFIAGAALLAFGKFMQRVDRPQTQLQGNRDHVDSIVLIAALDKRVTAGEVRMERAGKEMSDLATYVQGFDAKMRLIFPAQGECDAKMHESESDRKQIRTEIERIWQVINRKGMA